MPRSRSPLAFVLQAVVADIRRIFAWFRPVRTLQWRIEHAEQSSDWDELIVGIIDDPELSMRLVSLRGHITVGTIDAVGKALGEVADGAILHVDVTDAEFSDPIALLELERIVDQLEDRRVRIRMVGLSPSVTGSVD